jgi:hypothetical protein
LSFTVAHKKKFIVLDQAISEAIPQGLHAQSNDYEDLHPGKTSLHYGSAVGAVLLINQMWNALLQLRH